MGKKLRVNFIIIAIIFLLITCGGIFAAATLVPKSALTVFNYGAGTESDPYRIYNSRQLGNLQEVTQGVSNKAFTEGKYFRLDADVKLQSSYLKGCVFYGVFDGGGHTINAGGNVLFDTVGGGATVKNLNVNIDVKAEVKANSLSFCGLAVEVDKGGVIENCTVTGNIEVVKYTSTKYSATYTVGGICVVNYGTVKNCAYDGDIIDRLGYRDRRGTSFVAIRTVGGIAAEGSGVIENCTFNGDIDLYTCAYAERIFGISRRCAVKDCTVNGNITVRKQYSAPRLTVYGISETCENCLYNGNLAAYGLIEDRVHLAIANEGTFTHNGEIIG